jgi:hypothetical protein
MRSNMAAGMPTPLSVTVYPQIGAGIDLRNLVPHLIVDVDVGKAYGEDAPFFPHGVGGVGCQVHQYLMKLGGIGEDRGLGVDFLLDGDGCRPGYPPPPSSELGEAASQDAFFPHPPAFDR